MKARFALALVAALIAVDAGAYLVTIEPDDFADGQDLSNPYPGLNLYGVVAGTGLVPVLSRTDARFAPTGERVFGTQISAGWSGVDYLITSDDVFGNIEHCINGPIPDVRGTLCYPPDGRFFLAVFNNPTDLVALEGFGGSDAVILDVWDQAGRHLEGEAGLDTCYPNGCPADIQIARPAADISFVTAYTETGTGMIIDNLRFGAAGTDVPEPAPLALLALGVAGFGIARLAGRK